MYQHTRFNNKNNFFQKFGNLDYVLLSCLLILGFISLATMYSTDGGEILFHTRSHFIKFIVLVSYFFESLCKVNHFRHSSDYLYGKRTDNAIR